MWRIRLRRQVLSWLRSSYRSLVLCGVRHGASVVVGTATLTTKGGGDTGAGADDGRAAACDKGEFVVHTS